MKLRNLNIFFFILLATLGCKKEKGENQNCYIVDYLPTGCAGASETLGLRSPDGKFLEIRNDFTSSFTNFKVNDKVEILYEVDSNCAHCYACHCLAPDTCIKLIYINSCKKPSCIPVSLPATWDITQFDTSSNYSIEKARLQEDKLYLTISLSGCDIDISPSLIAIQDPNKMFPRQYDCYFIFNRTPQICNAVFTKTFCFDVSKIKTIDKESLLRVHNKQNTNVISLPYK